MRSNSNIQTLWVFALAAALGWGCETTPLAPVNGQFQGAIGAAGTPAPAPIKKGFDGLACEKDAECESEHCSNHVCCAKGDCCKVAEDCAIDTENSRVCEDSATCQGTHGTVTCNTSYRCVIKEGGVPDDIACDAMTEASDCGLYKSVFCNGTVDQKTPKCPETCATGEDCDTGAHCANGVCVADVPTGTACTVDTDCESRHCNHGFCCAMGDCCSVETDCDPTMYGAPPSCTDPKMCQGSRLVPACTDSQCGTRMADDDSACDRNVVSDACGDLPVKCRGGAEQQPPPPCATGTCGGFFTAATCNEGAFCWQGRCTPDQPDGESCTDDTSCQSGHCANNVCCSAGDCCTSDDQCPSIKMCTDAANCGGNRQDRHCDLDHGSCVNTGMPVDDDSGCFGMVAGTDCGLNPPARCSAAEAQTKPPISACSPCTVAPQCPAGAVPTGLTTCSTLYMCFAWDENRVCTSSDPAMPVAPIKIVPVGCLVGATKCTAGRCE